MIHKGGVCYIHLSLFLENAYHATFKLIKDIAFISIMYEIHIEWK